MVAEAIVQIGQLAAEVARSTEAMTLLQQESNKIDSVVDVIKAVVADEVRGLVAYPEVHRRNRRAGRWFTERYPAGGQCDE